MKIYIGNKDYERGWARGKQDAENSINAIDEGFLKAIARKYPNGFPECDDSDYVALRKDEVVGIYKLGMRNAKKKED